MITKFVQECIVDFLISKKRVSKERQEVSPKWLVNQMLDDMGAVADQIDARYLDLACGQGDFITEVLSRKLAAVEQRYGDALAEKAHYSLRALMSTYGVEMLEGELKTCRHILIQMLSEHLGLSAGDDMYSAAEFVISQNIVSGDGLTLSNNAGEPLILPQWIDCGNGEFAIHDYRFEVGSDVDAQASSKANKRNSAQNVRVSAVGQAKRWAAGKVTFDVSISPEAKKLQFDVIAGIPQFHRIDGGNYASAMPLYHEYVELAQKLEPRYVSMIIPARWLFGGRGLNNFRRKMFADKRVVKLVDGFDSRIVFERSDVAGGLCYFVWDKSYDGDCTVTEYDCLMQKTQTVRPLLESGMDVFIRSSHALSMLKKISAVEQGVSTEPSSILLPMNRRFDQQVSSQKPFGLRTYFRGQDAKKSDDDVLVIQSRGEGWMPRGQVPQGLDLIDKWKVFTGKSSSEHAGQADKNGQRRVLSRTGVIPPGSVVTETFIILGAFDTEEEARNCLSYVMTKFFRFLLVARSSGQDLSKSAYQFVPIQDFSKKWTDEELFAKYGMTDAESIYVTQMIR